MSITFLLIIVLLGGLGGPYIGAPWSYQHGGIGVVGIILIVLVILLLTGYRI
jgi:uncharacterized membrane protein